MNAFEWKVVVAVAVSIGVIWFLLAWTVPEVPARPDALSVPDIIELNEWGPDTLARTWYGPVLLMLVPGLFFWIGFTTDTREEARICIAFGLALLLIFGYVVRCANQPMAF